MPYGYSYSRVLKLGTSVFPLATSVASIEKGRTIGSAKLARAHGMRQTVGCHNGVRIELRVPLVRGPLDTSEVRPRIDAVRVILDQGPANLFLADDRYYRCVECEAEPTILGPTGLDRIHELSCMLVGPDDIWFHTSTESSSWTPTSGGTRVLTPTGNARTYPVFTFTVGGSGLETIAFTVTNNTTEEEFTLTGDVTAGDVITVNCLLKTCKIGTTDRLDLFDGIFPKLLASSNTIETAWTASSMTAATASWSPRYL